MLVSSTAAAEPLEDRVGPLSGTLESIAERAHSLGAVTGVGFDGRPSAGVVVRLGLTERLAIAALARARGSAIVEELDAIWQITQGKLAATYGERATYPIRFELITGVALVDQEIAASLGLALRVRASHRFTIDLSVRDEIARAERPSRFTHVPELQLALSWTAPHRVSAPDQ